MGSFVFEPRKFQRGFEMKVRKCFRKYKKDLVLQCYDCINATPVFRITIDIKESRKNRLFFTYDEYVSILKELSVSGVFDHVYSDESHYTGGEFSIDITFC